jgi:hypothetical protein
MSHLVPCGECRRHVRCGEGPCPFCGSAVADAPAPPLPDRALSRAALFVFASSVALGAACKSTSDQGPGTQPVVQTQPDTSQVALYGAPTPPAEVADASAAQAPPMAIYGAPAPPVEVADAGPPAAPRRGRRRRVAPRGQPHARTTHPPHAPRHHPGALRRAAAARRRRVGVTPRGSRQAD